MINVEMVPFNRSERIGKDGACTETPRPTSKLQRRRLHLTENDGSTADIPSEVIGRRAEQRKFDGYRIIEARVEVRVEENRSKTKSIDQ